VAPFTAVVADGSEVSLAAVGWQVFRLLSMPTRLVAPRAKRGRYGRRLFSVGRSYVPSSHEGIPNVNDPHPCSRSGRQGKMSNNHSTLVLLPSHNRLSLVDKDMTRLEARRTSTKRSAFRIAAYARPAKPACFWLRILSYTHRYTAAEYHPWSVRIWVTCESRYAIGPGRGVFALVLMFHRGDTVEIFVVAGNGSAELSIWTG
jgi:hypothetical protein